MLCLVLFQYDLTRHRNNLSFLHLLGSGLWPKTWSALEMVQWASEKNMYLSAVNFGTVQICGGQFSSEISLLNIYLNYLFVNENRVLRSETLLLCLDFEPTINMKNNKSPEETKSRKFIPQSNKVYIQKTLQLTLDLLRKSKIFPLVSNGMSLSLIKLI